MLFFKAIDLMQNQTKLRKYEFTIIRNPLDTLISIYFKVKFN